MTEYIRRQIDGGVDLPDTQIDISVIFGLENSGGEDIAAEGKPVIAEAIEADWIRRTR